MSKITLKFSNIAKKSAFINISLIPPRIVVFSFFLLISGDNFSGNYPHLFPLLQDYQNHFLFLRTKKKREPDFWSFISPIISKHRKSIKTFSKGLRPLRIPFHKLFNEKTLKEEWLALGGKLDLT